MFKKNFILLFFFGVLFALIGLVVDKYSTSRESSITKDDGQIFKVVKIVDGDTIQVLIDNKKETVRLIGIDTPEIVDPRKVVECFGKEASGKMKSLLNGRSVFLEDETNVNKIMIQEGFIHEFTYESNPYKYQFEFKLAEKKAREEKKGLWVDLKPSSCSKDNKHNYA